MRKKNCFVSKSGMENKHIFGDMVPRSAGFRVKRKYSAIPLPSSMIWSQLWLNQIGVLAFHRCRVFNERIITYVHICVLPKPCSSSSSSIDIPFHNAYIIHTNTIISLKFEEIPESSKSHTIQSFPKCLLQMN